MMTVSRGVLSAALSTGIIPRLRDPEMPARIEAHADWLANLRLRGNQLDFESVGNGERFSFFFGRKARRTPHIFLERVGAVRVIRNDDGKGQREWDRAK
jgi:hypothetical protein